MAIYVITANATSQSTPVLNATRVKVATTVPVFYATGVSPIAFSSNCALLPANTIKDIIVGDVNANVVTGVLGGAVNSIAFLAASGTGNVSITELGRVDFTKTSN